MRRRDRAAGHVRTNGGEADVLVVGALASSLVSSAPDQHHGPAWALNAQWCRPSRSVRRNESIRRNRFVS
jgi:hypothetical protein